MAGFQNIREWADSCNNGMGEITQFRKMSGATTIAGQWTDYTYAAGRPVANFYATTPLRSALIGDDKGFYVGSPVAPMKRFIHRLTTMMLAVTTGTTSQNVQLMLCDYLLAYPFCDMDAAGDDQAMIPAATLPERAGSGAGVKMMLVAQGQTVGGGTFTITYTNSAGVSDRVTPLHYCAAAQPAGTLVQAMTAASGVCPFITLQQGDVGVQSVQSINFQVANSGIAAIVLVKPIMTHISLEQCNNTTTFQGSASEAEAITSGMNMNEIPDGAVLGFIGQTMAGSVASAQLVGTIETIWR